MSGTPVVYGYVRSMVDDSTYVAECKEQLASWCAREGWALGAVFVDCGGAVDDERIGGRGAQRLMHETAAQTIRTHPRVALSPAVARRMLCFDLEQLMGTAGVTHQALAEWLGVSRPAVTAAMQGKTLFSRPAVEVICTRLERDEWLPRLDGLLATARRAPRSPEPGQRDAELVIGLEAFAEEVTVFDP